MFIQHNLWFFHLQKTKSKREMNFTQGTAGIFPTCNLKAIFQKKDDGESFQQWARGDKPHTPALSSGSWQEEKQMLAASCFPCCQGQVKFNSLVLTLETIYYQVPPTKPLPTSLRSSPATVQSPTLHSCDSMWGDSCHIHTVVSWLSASTHVFPPLLESPALVSIPSSSGQASISTSVRPHVFVSSLFALNYPVFSSDPALDWET